MIEGLGALGVSLSREVMLKEGLFLQELLRWNRKVNLTSITSVSEAQEKHLIDSLVLVKYIKGPSVLLDMGSGGGLPGIPLAIACPDLQVTSVDSVGKKINFQKHIKRLLDLKNLNPLCSRLENLTAKDGYHYVVARALSDTAQLVTFADPLLSSKGKLLVMKGPDGEKEISQFFAEKQGCNFVLAERYVYFLPFSQSERHLFILEKQ